jgi:hypothetical protein
MTNKNAITLIELLIGLILASILFLSVGVLSEIANSSFNKLNKEQQVYNDISYGLKLVQNRLRGSLSPISAGSQPAPWISGKHFQFGNDTFGLYQSIGSTDLIYDDGTRKETILSVPPTGAVDLSFPALSDQSITIKITGSKNEIPFDIQTTVFRRNS